MDPKEINDGYKILRNELVIKFKDAVAQNTIIKLDVARWIITRYVSVEVFYNLNYIENNQIISYNPLGDYVTSLMEDIGKYSSLEYNNPLKVAKRLWSLSRIGLNSYNSSIQYDEIIKRLNPILSSNAAALSQINSDIEVLIDMLSKPCGEYNKILIQILGFQKRIANHDLKDIDYFIDTINSIYGLFSYRPNRIDDSIYEIIDKLKGISFKLKKIIYDLSYNYLEGIKRENLITL